MNIPISVLLKSIVFFVICDFYESYGQTFYLDKRFANNGIAKIESSKKNYGFSICEGRQGKLLIAGADRSSPMAVCNIWALNPNGSLDLNFGNQGLAAIEMAGKSLVGRKILYLNNAYYVFADIYDSSNNLLLFQLDHSGKLNKNFGTNGFQLFSNSSNHYFIDAVYSNGSFFVTINSFDLENAKVLSINPDGRLNANFANKGVLEYKHPKYGLNLKSMLLLRSGQLLISGHEISNDAKRSKGFAMKINANGEFDLNFGINGKCYYQYGDTFLVLQQCTELKDNSLVFSGEGIVSFNNKFDFVFLKTNQFGQINKKFGFEGLSTVDYAQFENRNHHIVFINDSILFSACNIGGGSGDTIQSYAFFHYNYIKQKVVLPYGNKGILPITKGKSGDHAAELIRKSTGEIVLMGYSYFPPDNPLGFEPNCNGFIFQFADSQSMREAMCNDSTIKFKTVYPNPFAKQISLYLENCKNKTGILKYTLYDETGRLILNDETFFNSNSILLRKTELLAPAIYCLKLTVNNESRVVKIVKTQ